MKRCIDFSGYSTSDLDFYYRGKDIETVTRLIDDYYEFEPNLENFTVKQFIELLKAIQYQAGELL